MLYVLIPFAGLFAAYIAMENTYRFRIATALKITLTTMLTGCLAYAVVQESTAYRLLFTAGMAAAIAGDFFLQYIKRDNFRFICGVLAFGVTQLCYLAAMYRICPFRWKTLLCLLPFVVITACVKLFLRWDTAHADPYLSVYTVLVTLMAGVSLSVLVILGPSVGTSLLALGGILFYLSDMVLGIWSYQKTHILLADLNWLLYFGGQFLIAAGCIAL